MQIEALSKELYYDLGGVKPRGDNTIFFDEDCLKEIDIKWSTHKKVVLVTSPFFNLTKDENRILKPLKEAHKRQGTYWERAYQAVKHDRYNSLAMGNVKALIHSMSALYLLNLYYRQDEWNVSYQGVGNLDMSVGSAVFSVKKPVANQLWYGNNPVDSESPYIIQYKEEDYQKIKETQDNEYKALNEYWRSQPELNEPEFQQQLLKEQARAERIMPIWELAKYRLNKKISKEWSFEERKNALLSCPEWFGWIHQNNSPKKPEEITEENIQAEIDNLGIHTGIEIMKQYQPLRWINTAMSGAICVVKIGENSLVDTRNNESNNHSGKTASEFYLGANVFIDASKTLNVVGQAGVSQIKDKDEGLQLLGRMYIPGIVYQAFAAELYFKALLVHEGKQIKKIHKLEELLNMLDDSEKSIIKTRMISEIRNAKNVGESEYNEKELNSDFKMASRTFEDWRYFFENGSVSADMDFLNSLISVLQERCKALIVQD